MEISSSSTSLPGVLRTKLQVTVYWVLVIAAKHIADLWFVPPELKKALVMKLTRLASFFMGRVTSVDEYVGCQGLAQAIELDDEGETLSILKQYPDALWQSWLGATPLELAVRSSSLSALSVLLELTQSDPSEALKYCRDLATLEFLMARGAHPSALDREGRRAVDVVALNGFIHVAEAMIDEGAGPSSQCLRLLKSRDQKQAADRLEARYLEVTDRKRVFLALVLSKASNPVYAALPARSLIFQFLND